MWESINNPNNPATALWNLSNVTFVSSVVMANSNKPDEKLFEWAFPNNPELQGIIDSEYSAY